MSNTKYNQIIDEVYKVYADSHFTPPSNPKGKLLSEQLFSVIPMEHSKESFINKIKTNPDFSEKWGLKIEERELSLEERLIIANKNEDWQSDVKLEYERGIDCDLNALCNIYDIPTKLITITYNNKTIEVYE